MWFYDLDGRVLATGSASKHVFWSFRFKWIALKWIVRDCENLDTKFLWISCNPGLHEYAARRPEVLEPRDQDFQVSWRHQVQVSSSTPPRLFRRWTRNSTTQATKCEDFLTNAGSFLTNAGTFLRNAGTFLKNAHQSFQNWTFFVDWTNFKNWAIFNIASQVPTRELIDKLQTVSVSLSLVIRSCLVSLNEVIVHYFIHSIARFNHF